MVVPDVPAPEPCLLRATMEGSGPEVRGVCSRPALQAQPGRCGKLLSRAAAVDWSAQHSPQSRRGQVSAAPSEGWGWGRAWGTRASTHLYTLG